MDDDMTPPFSPARNHAEEIANVRAGFAPNPANRRRDASMHIPVPQQSGWVRDWANSLLKLTFAGFSVWPSLAASGTEQVDPLSQYQLVQRLNEEGAKAAFNFAFEAGDELSEFQFDASRGVGANIGEGRRFTRIPRADLQGPGEWATHFPTREGGANATSCIACHNVPIANGAGDIAQNVVLDPAHSGDPKRFLERNTPPIVALGPVQRLAEEMSLELFAQRKTLAAQTCLEGAGSIPLRAKGVGFGTLFATRTKTEPCEVAFDTNNVEGVDPDLVVRAFGWKGNHATIRSFTRGALHNELGLQAVETVGGADGDFDGVTKEITVGDLTALTIYMAALERPVTRVELAELGLDTLSEHEQRDIRAGAQTFVDVGCATCHTPEMELGSPRFSEPTETPGFFDLTFPDGSDPKSHGFEIETAVSFDMTRDQPNNRIRRSNGEMVHLGAIPVNSNGVPVFSWFSDLKRHDMGPELSDPDAPLGIAAQMWLTRSLAGVGSTGPWLHDGRATTLHDAIVAHGGEARGVTAAYKALPKGKQAGLLAFLKSLVLFKQDDGES